MIMMNDEIKFLLLIKKKALQLIKCGALIDLT